MRREWILIVVLVLAPVAASAGTLTSATWTSSLQGTPFSLTTGGGSLIASGSSTGAGANVALTVTPQLFITTTGSPLLTFIQTLGGSQTINVTSGSAVASQGIAGRLSVFLFVGIPLSLYSLSLSVGVSGTATFALNAPPQGARSATGTFFAWTPGSVTITGLFGTTTTPNGATNMSVPFPAFTTAGSFSLTAGGAGTITLVSPTILSQCSSGSFVFPCDGAALSTRTASATILTLRFVPEPATLVLLGAALAGLAGVGRRRG